MPNDVPTYNLKVVTHETGLTLANLRAWERRYGLLKPQGAQGVGAGVLKVAIDQGLAGPAYLGEGASRGEDGEGEVSSVCLA